MSCCGKKAVKAGYNSLMLPLPTSDPLWIATPQALQQMTNSIAAEPMLAIDTESNSLFAYKERVCLVQISTPAVDYLIDPLAIDDLSPLAPLFANPTQQKIFHAAEYDLICLKRDYSFTFSNIFDTMIAARILGEGQIGLGSLLSVNFSIEQEKKYQRANWGKRPLSKEMLDYARMDTHYLFALKALFEEKLKQKRLWKLAQEDFRLICGVDLPLVEPNGNSCWKVSGGARLSPRETAILQSLCVYRDKQARKMDLPLFKVFSNKLLVDLSRNAPHTKAELQQVPGISERLFKRYAEELLKVIESGEKATPPTRQPRQRPDKAMLERLNSLHEWRKEQGKLLKVESDIILPRNYMEKIAVQNPGNSTELKNIMTDIPWRYQHYGNDILKRLHSLEEHENTF